MEWTDESVTMLRKLWRDGLSAGQIAARLDGFSRNAVLGKLSRLKLLRSRAAASPPTRAPATPTPPPAGGFARPLLAAQFDADYPELDVPEEAFTPLPGVAPRPWLSRGEGACAFPVGGEGVGLMSCCAPVQGRSSYCPTHHARVFCVERLSRRRRLAELWAELVLRRAA